MGIGSRSVKVLTLGHRFLLWERGTQPGTLDGDCWNIRVWWLGGDYYLAEVDYDADYNDDDDQK